jgi:putative peptidoglycan lipid II flippase
VTAAPARPARGRLARNTAIFSIATGLSRIAGLVREVAASALYGTSGAVSAFTIAFQIPNLIRALFADAALSAAFVPVFTELLEARRRREAFVLASTFVALIVGVLGLVCAVAIAVAPAVVPLLTGDAFTEELDALTVGLTQVLFPIVLLLGLNGLVVGILNAYDHFSVPAISPLVWNLVIIAALFALQPLFDGPEEVYAYAIGVLAGTLVQLLMVLPVLRRLDFHIVREVSLRDPRVARVLALMLPVTIGLGLINFNMFISSVLATEVSREAPRAIELAFRIYMLPQGVFSVAVATVLFPALSRLATRRDTDGLRALTSSGVRAIFLLLIPCGAITLVLAEPITRLVYERGAFDAGSTESVADALFWFSFSLPFAGANLLLTRTFFSLQRPWIPTALAGATLLVNVAVALALYRPFGVPGIVVATAVASAAMTLGQARWLRRELAGRLEGALTLAVVARVLAASALLAAVAWGVHTALDALLGRSLPAQVLAVGLAVLVGLAVYAGAVVALRIPEAKRIASVVRGRLRRP